MATRVRKLARKLGRSSAEVLGLLHDLGYERYRSEEDMVSDAVAARLRQSLPKVAEAPPSSVPPPRAAPRRPADLMSQLVPGVVRKAEVDDERHERPPEPAPDRAPIDVERAERGLEQQRAALADQRVALAQERASLAELRGELETARAQLDADRALLDADRAALDRAGPGASAELPELTSLLQDRGLRGVDEFQRAMGALAGARYLQAVLGLLRVDEADVVRKLLDERLILVGGTVPQALSTLAGVSVSPERAELPDAATLSSLLEALGEQLLLSGIRRLLFVGVPASLHPILKAGMDTRVEIRFRPGGARSRADAEQDVTRTDVVVLYGVEVGTDARSIYETSRALLVEGAADLMQIIQQITDAVGAPQAAARLDRDGGRS